MFAPAFSAPCFFLADALPPLTKADWGEALSYGLVFLAIAAIAAVFLKNVRRDPPIEKEIDERIYRATSALEKRIDAKLNDLKQQNDRQVDAAAHLQASVEKGFHDLERSIGRIEGQCLNCAREKEKREARP